MYRKFGGNFKIVSFIILIMYVSGLFEQSNVTSFPNLMDGSADIGTSCEEFLANTTFDVNKVIDVDWKIFYFWTLAKESTYHLRFRIPSRLLTDRFRVELDKILKPPVNWTQAQLFMETTIDFSALYIRTETPGKFRLIPSIAFQAKSVPLLIFAVKYVEPGYLGIMNCKYRLCYALAPVDKMPNPDDLKKEAEKIGFTKEHGYSYLVQPAPPPSPVPYTPDDDDDDEDTSVEERGFQRDYIGGDGDLTEDDDEDD